MSASDKPSTLSSFNDERKKFLNIGLSFRLVANEGNLYLIS
jgi:hypothetical protein